MVRSTCSGQPAMQPVPAEKDDAATFVSSVFAFSLASVRRYLSFFVGVVLVCHKPDGGAPSGNRWSVATESTASIAGLTLTRTQTTAHSSGTAEPHTESHLVSSPIFRTDTRTTRRSGRTGSSQCWVEPGAPVGGELLQEELLFEHNPFALHRDFMWRQNWTSGSEPGSYHKRWYVTFQGCSYTCWPPQQSVAHPHLVMCCCGDASLGYPDSRSREASR